jgi:hypothetical protein
MTYLRSIQLILVLLVESALVYTVSSILGGVLGMGGSSLNLVAIFVILGSSCMVSLYFQTAHGGFVMPQVASFGIGILVLYLAVGISVKAPVGLAGEYAWIIHSFEGQYEYVELGRQVLGMMIGVAIWSRGMSIAATHEINDLLFRSFRIGSVVVTFGSAIDALFPIWMGMEWVAPIFFLSGLLCLVLTQFDSNENGAMVRLGWMWLGIAIAVLVVMIGIAFTFTVGGAASDFSKEVIRSLGVGITYILLVLAIPMLYVADWVINSLFWVLNWVLGDGWQGQVGQVLDRLDAFEGFRGEGSRDSWDQSWLAALLKWGIISTFFIGLFGALFFSYVVGSRRRRALAHRTQDTEKRGVSEDVWNLLKKLIPDGIDIRRGVLEGTFFGNDSRGIILRAYYTTLERAERNGFPRPAWQTSFEYQKTTLARILPSTLSFRLTSAFNQARYSKRSTMNMELAQATGIEEECQSEKGRGLA